MAFSQRSLLSMVLAGCTAFCLTIPTFGVEGETWAVLIGVDNYSKGGVSKLRYAGADAKLFARTLTDKLKVKEKNVFLYTTDSTDENSKPSLPNVVYRLDWLRQNAGPNDTVIFYFAGHGINKDGETYLLTQEADPRAGATLKITSLNGSTVYENLGQSKARNTLVLLDACRNDPTVGRGDASNPLDEKFERSLVFNSNGGSAASLPSGNGGPSSEGRNLATLFACSVGERSWESEKRAHGYFTYYLVEALTKAATPDGKITLQTVTNYIRKEVNEDTHRSESARQTPMLRYEGPSPDSWVLASAAPVALGALPADPIELQRRLEREQARAKAAEAAKVAGDADKKLLEEKARAADEKAAIAEAKRYELEIQNKALEKRAALMEMERQAGISQSSAGQEALKADLEKARVELQKVSLALNESEGRAEAARKKKEEAELRATQLESLGKSKDAEKARAEALESSSAMLAERAKAENTRRLQVEAENQELLKRMALLEVKANEGLKGNEAAQKLQKELDQARDEVRVARQLTQASEARAEAAKMAVAEAETNKQSAEREAQAALARANSNTASPEVQKEISRLTGEAEKYKKLLEEAKQERLSADLSAKKAESSLAGSEREFEKKWSGRPLGNRPTRKTKLIDIMRVVDDEATELRPQAPAPSPESK